MSDLMLLGILRMPDTSIAGDCAGFMQFVSVARSAADRIESDARIIEQLRAELEAAAADRRERWHSMDCAPLDGTWIMLFARYPEATASIPTFGFYREGKWWQSTRLGISELIPTYWMPRPAFPNVLAQQQEHS